MEFNLEKAIADYANEAMNMSRRSADYLTVPKPEPPPPTKSETKTETKSKPKTKPQIKNQSKGGKAVSKSATATESATSAKPTDLTEEEEFLLNGFDD
ncbi:MAG: hypothetical protein FWF82_06565, partial [Oscillospiraceae bacterium]|nr:hypothetical protein [Oscillospiraceae bacterium]